MSQNETIHTSSTGGQKAGNDVRASLLPWAEVMEVAELFGRGARKYDAHNWTRGYNWSLSYDALMRHLTEWWLGNEFDDGEGGTGLEHLTCVIFHSLVLMWFRKHRPEFDDRFKLAALEQDPVEDNPRQWETFSAIPGGVYQVNDNAGRRWISWFGQTYWTTDDGAVLRDSRHPDLGDWGPFTEIID